MDLPARAIRTAARLSAASVLLHNGADQLGADAGTAASLHRVAVGTVPALSRVGARTFLRGLAGTELALGAALALPVVPARVAGVLLTLLAAGRVGLHLRSPTTDRGTAPGPTADGLVVTRDAWLLAVGCGLVLSDRRR